MKGGAPAKNVSENYQADHSPLENEENICELHSPSSDLMASNRLPDEESRQ